jgi:hypothetical protein
MAPHWKCGSGQPVAGSNPALSATSAVRLDADACVADLRCSLTHLGVRSLRCSDAALPSTPIRTALDRCLDVDGCVGALRASLTHRPEAVVERRLLESPGRARRGTSGALYLQSAPAGLNPLSRSPSSDAARRLDVEDRVPRSGEPRTVSGPEGSSTKRSSSGAAERPGPSRPPRWARGRSDRRRVHGSSVYPRPVTKGGS